MDITGMERFNMIKDPVSNLRSFLNSTGSAPDGSILPNAVHKITSTKLYSRIKKRSLAYFTTKRRSKLRRISSTESYHRSRLQKWQACYSKDRKKLPNRNSATSREYQSPAVKERSPSIRTPPSKTISLPSSSSSPSLLWSSSSSSSLPSSITTLTTPGSWPTTPPANDWERTPILFESDQITLSSEEGHFSDTDSQIDIIEGPLTPSPILDSPTYGRTNRYRNVDSQRALNTRSPLFQSRSCTELPKKTLIINDFSPYLSEDLDEDSIDRELMDLILTGPSPVPTNNTKGRFYTAVLTEDDSYVKIGMTTKSVKKRVRQIPSPGIGYGTIRNVEDKTPGAQAIYFNSLHAESIIHLELCKHRRIRRLTKQKEWFQIHIDEAHKITRKWRNWLIKYNPYDKTGRLNAFWMDRIQNCGSYDEAKHRSIHERWEKILNPTWWEMTFYYVRIGWSIFCVYWAWIQAHPLITLASLTLVLYCLYGTVAAVLCGLISLPILSRRTEPESTRNTRGKKKNVTATT